MTVANKSSPVTNEATQEGVVLKGLSRGTRLIVGTSRGECKLVVLCPEKNLVMVWGYDPRLTGITAILGRSIYGGTEKRAFRSGAVWHNMQMELQFKNHTLLCPPTVSLRVEGDDWFYDVF